MSLKQKQSDLVSLYMDDLHFARTLGGRITSRGRGHTRSSMAELPAWFTSARSSSGYIRLHLSAQIPIQTPHNHTVKLG